MSMRRESRWYGEATTALSSDSIGLQSKRCSLGKAVRRKKYGYVGRVNLYIDCTP